ncbi:arabinogalactan endo-1,4-beta-galactosidase [Kineococcus xinjiangensis]|uniref:Arabinogalactan endo-beta-1,4-galactanase n=1 Tax=Kineococcus xinjiangensis TaxID=512762 RepID=A0A2S6IVW1_9ACTN|nr:arabinogalactan endo-1,4-beta-galactosidase [Kineococcus xinjiangensis]PPK98416.1 arabinogalactan endo-1,4-beta-galactosidase [Kineococcus xinjiangensis]
MSTQRTTALTRRGLLSALPVAAGAVALGAAPATAAGPAAGSSGRGHALSIRGADISFTPQLEAAGITFSDGGHVRPIEHILRANGANWIRLRLWVNPPAGYSDIASVIEMTRRAKRSGLKVLLDFHYSDFWADPAHQTIPAAWRGQDLAALAETVRSYTRTSLEQIEAAGGRVDMVQVGNEITAGMLWPIGKLYGSGAPKWKEFTTLLKAGIAGVHDSTATGARIPTMLHIDRGGRMDHTRWFFDNVLAEGVEFDVIGQSYYPFWHGSFADLSANLTDSAERYGRDVVLVETAYPWTLENGDGLENFIYRPSQLPDGGRFPASPEGQAAYFEALRAVLVGIPGGRGLGFFAWEPEWLPGVGWAPGEGNPNDNLTMFDRSGAALPALRAFRPAR